MTCDARIIRTRPARPARPASGAAKWLLHTFELQWYSIPLTRHRIARGAPRDLRIAPGQPERQPGDAPAVLGATQIRPLAAPVAGAGAGRERAGFIAHQRRSDPPDGGEGRCNRLR